MLSRASAAASRAAARTAGSRTMASFAADDVRANVSPDVVDEMILGNVLSAGVGQALARQVALFGGLPKKVPCTTVNKVCASGMKAVMLGAQSIMAGQNGVVMTGGVESMSNVPYYLPGARGGMRLGHGQVVDGIINDGLWDVYNDHHMGNCGEKCAAEHSITREQQDAFAALSYTRAIEAIKAGRFADEIVPVEVKSRRSSVTVDADEEPFKMSIDSLAGMRAVFQRDGTVTAGNASGLNDGASALMLMSGAKATELGVTPLARIRGFGDAATEPVDFTVAPSLAVPVALRRAGLELSDVDYHEINEAFSVVSLVNMKLMDLDESRVNVNGGAVSLGHPIGASGARIITTLINVLRQRDASIGCASICNGGGGASAIVIERL
ncbi:hypothetical protein FNF28_02679 [Cafeteria roenbergensis]|uniref:Acetyl-CoA acetyltransferase n=1 Tax=Cafeteria roenbergensis TaxID=33653 RepID=A0A5A8DRA9_CAFRO|nr:hypothetical protein FNF28_02679 [Cafeteria roenbergensis]